LRTKFSLSLPVMKDALRDFKESKGHDVTPDFQKLLFAIETISVSVDMRNCRLVNAFVLCVLIALSKFLVGLLLS
jgi:hypothetical protein